MRGKVDVLCQRQRCLLTRCAWPKPSTTNMARISVERNSIHDAPEIVYITLDVRKVSGEIDGDLRTSQKVSWTLDSCLIVKRLNFFSLIQLNLKRFIATYFLPMAVEDFRQAKVTDNCCAESMGWSRFTWGANPHWTDWTGDFPGFHERSHSRTNLIVQNVYCAVKISKNKTGSRPEKLS